MSKELRAVTIGLRMQAGQRETSLRSTSSVS